jgi:hypothetical protein
MHEKILFLTTAYGTRWRMGPDWTDEITKALEEQLGIKCCLRLKYKNKLVFAEGSCRECPFKIEMTYSDIVDSTNPNSVRIAMRTLVDFDNEQHMRDCKRKVSGANRLESSKALDGQLPLQFYEGIINRKKEINPNVPSLTTIRKIRSEKRLELRIKMDEYAALRNLQYHPDFSNVIKCLQTFPRYLNIFWSEEQQSIVNNTKQYVLMIDATGSLVQDPLKKELDSYAIKSPSLGPIYFYLALMRSHENEKSVPVSQMLSQSHNANTTIQWLSSFADAVKNVPDEVWMDCSSMLMLAACKSYNNCTTVEYLKYCYSALEGEKFKIKTLIRIDKSHMCKIFARWKIWGRCGKDVKRFYVKILKTIVSEEDFSKAKLVIQNIIVIMESSFMNAHLQASFDFLQKYVDSRKDDNNDLEEKGVEADEENIMDDVEISDVMWFDDVYLETKNQVAENDDQIGTPNAFCLPAFKKDLSRVSKTLPLWSNIMMRVRSNSFPPTCTTSSLESEFKTIKHIILHNVKPPLRSDVFMQLFLRHVSAQCVIYNDMRKRQMKVIAKQPVKVAIDQAVLELSDEETFSEENWKGQNSNYQKMLARQQPEISLRPNSFTTKIGDDLIFIFHTCPINPFVHGFLCLANENAQIKSYLTHKCSFFNLITSIMHGDDRDKVNRNFYKMITKTELNQFVKIDDEGINCEMTIDSFLTAAFPELIKATCLRCKSVKGLT